MSFLKLGELPRPALPVWLSVLLKGEWSLRCSEQFSGSVQEAAALLGLLLLLPGVYKVHGFFFSQFMYYYFSVNIESGLL